MIGTTLSTYKITAKLGEGGMGEVYRATDSRLGREVAIKVLSKRLGEDELAQRRLLEEAKAAAAIDHPFVCKVYEVGASEGRDFIAMEFVEGEDLANIICEGSLSLKESIAIAGEITEALQRAHERGILHRDLKPSNVMVTPDKHVKVMDFGLAKRTLEWGGDASRQETAFQLTQPGAVMGTLGYMSPEQIRGEALDARSDQFSLGILLNELVFGSHPFRRPTAGDTCAAILGGDLSVPEAPAKHQELWKGFRKMMSPEREARFSGLDEVMALLQGDLAGRSVNRPNRSPLGLKVLLGFLLLVGISTGIYFAVRKEVATPEPVGAGVVDFKVDEYTSRAMHLLENFGNHRDLELSLENWQRVLELVPESATGLAGGALARAMIAWNSLPEPQVLDLAEKGAEEAIEKDPEAALGFVALSMVYQMRGLIDTADEMSERSVEIAPDNLWVLQSRARFLMDRYGRYEQAEALALRATELAPSFAPGWFQLGWSRYELELSQEAEDAFRQAITQRPDFGSGFMGLGIVQTALGQFETAVKTFQEALDIDEDNFHSILFQGIALHELGDTGEALQRFHRVAESNPGHPLTPWALLYQGLEYERLDRPEERDLAFASAERHFKSVPQIGPYLGGLAGVAAARGNLEEAIGWLRQAPAQGLRSVHVIGQNPAFESLESDPRFQEILDEIRRSRSSM
jgi:serine/threonine protein kinase/Tfp pilus assembly protein PilF